MRQFQLKLPPARPDAVKRMIRSACRGRCLKMACDTTNATIMVADGVAVHLIDIDAEGKETLVAQFVKSPEQKTTPKFIRTGQKHADPDPPETESKEPEKAVESPAVISASPPASVAPALTQAEALKLRVEQIKAKMSQR